ncbi:alpha/beta hydrolase family protein [Nocardia sp. CDC153]|uniref:alpha/beta hydrolase n=1 Tax=Nocardia sp. CDC153 TaxID=3112167 RepID=UPI002DBA89FC|nr:alpha/beta hydrolase family protein [Nocardia sp. CDC153]MEC3955724.1 alpha/beta hydrolase family protein [Nocardia sp. CDC153]
MASRSARRLLGALAGAAIVLGATVAEAPLAPADPPVETGSNEQSAPGVDPVHPAQARIERVEPLSGNLFGVAVASPAMGRTVEVQVLLPSHRDAPRPTVYMLDGRSAAAEVNNWTARGDALRFFADKNVNVVFTLGGPASYYTDWRHGDPKLGTNRWETFLTRELPPLLDARFGGDGRNGLEGVSMGAEAAMMLATRNPDVYRAVAAHSGCYAMSSDFGQAQARAVIGTFGGDPDNMFGPADDPEWADHDVLAHAEALRGKAVYLSSGSGLPGEHDTPGNPDLRNAVLFGGPIEAGSDMCTRQLADRLTQLGIPATVHRRPTGTHSWPYWADELPRSWPTVAAGLGLE